MGIMCVWLLKTQAKPSTWCVLQNTGKNFCTAKLLTSRRQHKSEELTFSRTLIPEVMQIVTLWTNWLLEINAN